MKMEQLKSNRGGARPGSGRPKIGQKSIHLRLDEDLTDFLATFSNKNRFINDLIRQAKDKIE